MTVTILAGLVLGPTLGAHAAIAQIEPFKLQFTAPEFSLRLRPQRSLPWLRQAAAPARPPVVVECPMPVFVPDLSRVERMPVAPVDPTGHAMQVVPFRCVNPLGPQARVPRRTALPPHP
jgi:hypothetical protein